MKKILESIVAITLTVIGLLLIALLLVLMFNGIDVRELDNQLVKVLIVSLSVVFTVLAGMIIAISFSDSDRLNSIILFKDKESATKATVSVVKKMVKKASKRVLEAKVTKVSLFGDENNNVKLAISLKIKSDKTEDVIDRVRGQITATCNKILVYEFAAIDFKVVKLQSEYVPSTEEINKTIEEYKQENEIIKIGDADIEESNESVVVGDDIAIAEQEGTEIENIIEAEKALDVEKVAEVEKVVEIKKEAKEEKVAKEEKEAKEEKAIEVEKEAEIKTEE